MFSLHLKLKLKRVFDGWAKLKIPGKIKAIK